MTALDVKIIGGGIGGVAASVALTLAGCKVTILEAAPEIGEIGAGIQVPPNVSNLLQKWGAAKFLGDRAVKPKDFRIYRWETGKPIGRSDLNPIMESNLGSPWWTLHRHDLLTCLLKRAQELGVVIRANSRVTSVDLDAPAITLQTGERITADLFIGADGVKSVIRNTIFPGSRPYNPGGTAAAYRMSVKTADLRAVDEEMNKLFEEPAMNLWMGQNRYLITYPMSGNEYINVVTSHPHPTPPDAPDKECQEDALKDFADFPPAVTKVIQASTWCTRWGLLLTKPLPTWNAPSHRVTLLGDSAHSMFPHMGQGAAMAIEDAAVLGRVADHVNRGHLTLTEALDIYVDVRLNRATETQERSITQGYIWQFPDGPDQQARDRAMSVELNGSHYLRTPNLWGDPRTQVLQYGYRCENHAEDEIAQHLKRKRNQYGWSGVRKHVEDHSLNWFLNDLGRRPEPATTMMAPVDSHA